jgi:hypothetical protein
MVLVLTSVAVINLMAVGAVQVSQITATITTSATSTLPGTTTITTTIMSTQYSNATSITTSTSIQGTQITTVYSTTTAQINSATTISTGEPTITTSTLTQTSTVRLLSSMWGEWLVGLAGVAAIATILASVVVPGILAGSKNGIICGECGYQNPPFVKSYCTECGKPLRIAKLRKADS